MPRDRFPEGDEDPVALLYSRAEQHELAAERYLLEGDARKGARELALATTYRRAGDAHLQRERAAQVALAGRPDRNGRGIRP